MSRTIVIALGGNAIAKAKEKGQLRSNLGTLGELANTS